MLSSLSAVAAFKSERKKRTVDTFLFLRCPSTAKALFLDSATANSVLWFVPFEASELSLLLLLLLVPEVALEQSSSSDKSEMITIEHTHAQFRPLS